MQDKFKSILETNAFDQLTSYREPQTWKSMSVEERELLGILFVKQGEHQFRQSDNRALESFELSTKVAPNSSQIYFKQALVYAAQGENIRCLIAADKALAKSTQLDAGFIHAWHIWGNILTRMGLFYEEASYFQKADEKFLAAEQKILEIDKEHAGALYWHWGLSWYHLGKHSGEAIDFSCSLEKFRQAEARDFDSAEFHYDYGNALVQLAFLVGREEQFLEAADHYEKSALLDPLNHDCLFSLGCTYQRLFEFSSSRDFFFKADECFERASEADANDPLIWQRWAELYAYAGKVFRDLDRLQESLAKFWKSESIESGNPYHLLKWSETQIYIASMTENLEMIREAEEKIGRMLKAIPDEAEAWYVYGLCLIELGRYFADESYYTKAIDKFQQGISLSSANPLLMHGTALAHFALGELKNDKNAIEKSVEYFSKAADCSGRVFPQVLNDWGVALMKLGEITSERSHIEQAAAKFEETINSHVDAFDKDDIELEWLYNYGCAMDFLGDFHDEPSYYENAVQVLSHVLRIAPDYHNARYNLALALVHLGELKSDPDCFYQSLDYFQEILERDPEDEIVWNDFGLALLNLGLLTADPVYSDKPRELFEQAEGKLLNALSLGSLPALYHLACLYALTGQPNPAMYYLEKAEQSGALPPCDDVIQDEWLDGLRDQPAFRLFISRLINKRDESPS